MDARDRILAYDLVPREEGTRVDLLGVGWGTRRDWETDDDIIVIDKGKLP